MRGPTRIFWANLTPFSLKIVRVVRAFRLLKLLRLVRIKRILDRWEEEMYGKRALRVAKLLFGVLVISHWLCCGWFFAGDTAPRPGQYIPDEIVEGWVSETYPAAVRSAGVAWDMYFQTWFWASMTTISSPTPSTTPEIWEEKVHRRRWSHSVAAQHNYSNRFDYPHLSGATGPRRRYIIMVNCY